MGGKKAAALIRKGANWMGWDGIEEAIFFRFSGISKLEGKSLSKLPKLTFSGDDFSSLPKAEVR